MPESASPAPPRAPAGVHEWVSFESSTEQRTWVFDATFLLSDWSCIFGHGCKGVLDADATEMAQGCCSYGAHFIDDDDVQTVLRSVARLTPKHWQFAKQGRKKGFLGSEDGVTTTRLVDDACIFLNRPGFEGGIGCALHSAALEAGERPIDWKPAVCWQLPLRLVEHVDEHGHTTSSLQEWKRRDWGPGGFEFHWWCTEGPEAFVGREPVYRYMRDEIVEMIGADTYETMVGLLERAGGPPAPHPAVAVAPPSRRRAG